MTAPVELPSRFRKALLAIVPHRPRLKAALINLNSYAVRKGDAGRKSDFLNPRLTHLFLDKIARKYRVETTLGGYFEDRRHLWRGSYLNPESAVHLAIDVNLPAGTPVACRYPSTLEKVIRDPDQDGGWGTVAVFRLEKPLGDMTHFLYAHLDPAVTVSPGQRVRPGQTVGHIGRPDVNGGWYEHLHVQGLSRQAWERTKGDIRLFDGYGTDSAAMRQDFPDPFILIADMRTGAALRPRRIFRR